MFSFPRALLCCALNCSNLRDIFFLKRQNEFLQTGTSGFLENSKLLLESINVQLRRAKKTGAAVAAASDNLNFAPNVSALGAQIVQIAKLDQIAQLSYQPIQSRQLT